MRLKYLGYLSIGIPFTGRGLSPVEAIEDLKSIAAASEYFPPPGDLDPLADPINLELSMNKHIYDNLLGCTVLYSKFGQVLENLDRWMEISWLEHGPGEGAEDILQLELRGWIEKDRTLSLLRAMRTAVMGVMNVISIQMYDWTSLTNPVPIPDGKAAPRFRGSSWQPNEMDGELAFHALTYHVFVWRKGLPG